MQGFKHCVPRGKTYKKHVLTATILVIMDYMVIRCLLVYCLLIFDTDSMFPKTYFSYLAKLQELCPYTSFCEHDAVLTLPENETRRPCCKSCSCTPGCELLGNCCFDYKTEDELHVGPSVKCMSPVVSRTNIPTTNYIMINSCSKSNNFSLCEVNDTDYRSFAPVTDFLTNAIYVNAECAYCNEIHLYDLIKWKIAIKCPYDKEDHAFDTVKLFDGDDAGGHGCHMVYIPPDRMDTEPRECVTDVIRECNVNGILTEREPMWDYCPMFNATYTHSAIKNYGNIFCFLCNTHASIDIEPLCESAAQRFPITSHRGFTAILDVKEVQNLTFGLKHNRTRCSQAGTFLSVIKLDCSRKVCPRGKIKVGSTCGYYSKKWHGGPFTAILKLTPIGSVKINKTFIQHLPPEKKYNAKANWLKRDFMQEWDVKTLYRPSNDGENVDYLIALLTYPDQVVNPTRLENELTQTLKETWLLNVMGHTFPLHVQLNEHKSYSREPKGFLETGNIFINEDYAFITDSHALEDNKDKYLFPINVDDTTNIHGNEIMLDELFLCDQVELQPNEFEIRSSELWINGTNEPLVESQFRLLESGSVSVCVNRLQKGSNLGPPVVFGCQLKYMFLYIGFVQLIY